jgi:hypothetical protein
MINNNNNNSAETNKRTQKKQDIYIQNQRKRREIKHQSIIRQEIDKKNNANRKT